MPNIIMSELSRDELDDVYAFAIWLGKEAGKMLMEGANVRMRNGTASAEQKEHVQKENAVDLVTQTDEGTLVGVLSNRECQISVSLAWLCALTTCPC